MRSLLTTRDIPGQSPYISLGGLGLTGRTAWCGAFREMNLKPEHTLLVSGAAGAVGSALVQIAKHVIGCKRVVGIAGGDEKCAFVKSLGADACVDYKHADFGKELKEALQGEADFFFDNVGGEVLNEALTVVKRYGFVSVCGAISGESYAPHPCTSSRLKDGPHLYPAHVEL
jgi:NADPH-dependent curcumin reductase CurA